MRGRRPRTGPGGASGKSGTGGGARRLAEALLIAAVSPALPGVAHLRAGRVRLGAALLGAQAVLLTAAAITAGHGRSLFLELTVRPGWLLALTVGSAVLAGLWAALIVHSYAVLAPGGLPPLWRLAGGTTVSVLCLLAVVPPLTVARFGQLQRDLVGSVFSDGQGAGPAAVPPGTAAAPRGGGDPWARIRRPDYAEIRRKAARAVRDSGSASHETSGLHILSNSCT